MEKYGRWPFFEPKNLGKSLEATVDTGGDYRPGVPEGGRSGYGEGYPAGMWLQSPFRAGNSLLFSGPEQTRRQEIRKSRKRNVAFCTLFPGYTFSISHGISYLCCNQDENGFMVKRIIDYLVEMTSTVRVGDDSNTQEVVKQEVANPALKEGPKKRRSLNDKNSPHPGEYWGFKELEEGEGISHSTACKLSKDPDLLPAFRYVGRSVRVDIAKLHELQRKKAAEKNKPISNNPRRNKKTPTL